MVNDEWITEVLRVKILHKFPVGLWPGFTLFFRPDQSWRSCGLSWSGCRLETLGIYGGGSRNDPQSLDSWMLYSENPNIENYWYMGYPHDLGNLQVFFFFCKAFKIDHAEARFLQVETTTGLPQLLSKWKGLWPTIMTVPTEMGKLPNGNEVPIHKPNIYSQLYIVIYNYTI